MRTRLLISFVCCAAISIGVAPALRAQTQAADQSAPSSALSPRLRARIDRLADSARVMGVPAQPLYLKAAEGALKGADDDRVAVVVSRMLAELREARRGLGADVTSAELMAGASVVHAGLDVAALRRIRAARPDARAENALLMPLVVLADLVARHVTPEIATASVIALAERGAPDAEFASLRSVVDREIRRGQPPDVATRARTAVILGGLPRAEGQGRLGSPRDPVTRP